MGDLVPTAKPGTLRAPIAPPDPPKHASRPWPGDDETLLIFGEGEHPENGWRLRDAFEGTQIFGGTGSGKTSGSGNAIARRFLESGMGGLVLTAKNDEVLNWMELCNQTGRFEDLWVFSPKNNLRFNFLQYEMQRKGEGAGQTENLVNLFCTVLEIAERRKGGQVGGGDSYWLYSLKQLLRNTIDLILLAKLELTLPTIYRIIASAPQSTGQLEEESWQNSSTFFACLAEAIGKSPEHPDLEIIQDYCTKEFPGLAVETRSVIVSMFTGMADCFLRGTLRELFCTGLNVSPEVTFEGKILVLNLPIKEWNELGQFSQALFKYLWQRAVERRIPPEMSRKEAQSSVRPVFLWADESQFFANSYDAQFQSTARSSRSCTVYLTQNLPNYIAVFGSNGRPQAESFLGNLQTKIFHANGDPTTNSWAADSIGKMRQIQLYGGLSQGFALSGASGINHNAGGSMTVDYLVQPQEFTVFRTGGPDYDFTVDGIIFQAGRSWLHEDKVQNYVRHQFRQRR